MTTTSKTLREMSADIRAVNIEKGWRRPEGGPGDNTFREYRALLHSEIAEATDAYRKWRLTDATQPICGRASAGENPCPDHGPAKPEGVGSELADTLIRILDTGDVFGIRVFDMDLELGDISPLDVPADVRTFGDFTDWLHCLVANMTPHNRMMPTVLRALVATAERFGIDLAFEYERKIAHNRTRKFQPGGRTLSDTIGSGA